MRPFFVGGLLTCSLMWCVSSSPASAQCAGGAPDGFYVSPPEQCDDNNTVNGDGCSSTCRTEAGFTCAPPIDFVSLTTLDYGASASWTVSADGLTGTQNNNTTEPTIALFGADAMSTTYTFDLTVNTASDDDFVGFVVGFDTGDLTSASADYLLLDWKQAAQGCGSAGMAVSRVTGRPPDLGTFGNFWCHTAPAATGPGVRELARATLYGAIGWIDLRTYRFSITYSPTRFLVTVQDRTTLVTTTAFDLAPPMGTTWPTGQLGFYGLSQEAVRYTVIGPRGPSTCNRPPVAPDASVWTVNGPGTRCFGVTSGVTDPDSDAIDPASIRVLSAPAGITATDPSTGAGSGQICTDLVSDSATGDFAVQYRVCDDVTRPNLCDTATLTVRYNDAPTLTVAARTVLGGSDMLTLAAVQASSSQGMVVTGWDTSSAQVATNVGGTFGASAPSALGGTCSLAGGILSYSEPTTGTATSDTCALRLCESEPGPLGTDPAGRACATVVLNFGLDADLDGIPNRVEGTTDGDEDTIADYLDRDSDDDGIPDEVERGADGASPLDSDNDGVFDFRDRDSDGDGLSDTREAGGGDANGDGVLDAITDADGDGLADAVDPDCGTGCAGVPLPLPDTDGDGAADRLDLDSDQDGVGDQVESRDVDGNGTPDVLPSGVDDNDDGFDDLYASTAPPSIDRDGDGTEDNLDQDDDGDGILSRLELSGGGTDPSMSDFDMDGLADFHDADDDDDGVLTRYEAADPSGDGDPSDARDSDLDTRPDYLDPDDDGDGLLSRFESNDANGDGNPDDAEDSDGDATPDFLDPDDDGDGVLTEFEGADPNDDGNPADARNTNGAQEMASGAMPLPDYLDPDDDGDTLPTSAEAPDADGDGNPLDGRDSDGDGVADWLDPDDDGDMIDTSVEVSDGAALTPPSEDVDADSTPNWLDEDSDGDGVDDSAEGRGDLDSDGVPNYLDADSAPRDTDNDGINDEVECTIGTPPAECPDSDNDGIFDWMDPDDDGDGVPTADERARGDTDQDNAPNYLDPDDDGDGNPTSEERPGGADRDTDGDGTPDYVDDDDDGDGIPTAQERGDSSDLGSEDPDADGNVTWLDTDADGDGSSDMDECADPSMGCPDRDQDGTPGYLDPDEQPNDSDGDGVPDEVECPTGTACPDSDNDGTPDVHDTDDDGDGVPTRTERVGGLNTDTDEDGTPDYLDDDDDGDSIPTRDERDPEGLDTDLDGRPNYLDGDDDEDGIPTRTERMNGSEFGDDVDGDALANWLDIDSDGDGALDAEEGTDDADGDGIPNYLDAEDGSATSTYGGLAGGALCNAAPGASSTSALLAIALVVLALSLRRKRMKSALLLIALAAIAPSGRVAAQALRINTYRAAELASDGFAISRANDLGHVGVSAMLQVDYGLNPLVWEAAAGETGSETFPVIQHQLTGTVGLGLGLFDRLVLYAGLPVNLLMIGEDPGTTGAAPADGTTLSDVYMGARLRLFGEHDDVFAMALQGTVSLPTSQWAHPTQRYSGDDGAVVEPRLVLEVRPGSAWISANVGARIRATDRARLQNLWVSHELTWGLGIGVPLGTPVVSLLIEAHGATTFTEFAVRDISPVEALGGFRFQPVAGFNIGLAAGAGISRGYGAPDLRGVVTLGYATPARQAPAEPAPPPAPRDRDNDGIVDASDHCPSEAEDVDSFEDDDGCPDYDNDRDGIRDTEDGAPMDPEDPDGYEDTDGVPDPDNDGDGLTDEVDHCPVEAEDIDGFEDTDGCPENDNDHDAVLDVSDECPLDPGRPEDNGCPRAVRVDRETGNIQILQRVEFATSRDTILPSSFAVLEEVRAVLEANPSIVRVRIEGHTDSRGRDDRNMALSRRRGASVRRWMLEHGMPGERFEAWGCGELHPIEPNETNEGRQANRRVEFHILEPTPPGGARTLSDCQRSD